MASHEAQVDLSVRVAPNNTVNETDRFDRKPRLLKTLSHRTGFRRLARFALTAGKLGVAGEYGSFRANTDEVLARSFNDGDAD